MICLRPAGPAAQDWCASHPADLVFAGAANALNWSEKHMCELWLLLSPSLWSSETGPVRGQRCGGPCSRVRALQSASWRVPHIIPRMISRACVVEAHMTLVSFCILFGLCLLCSSFPNICVCVFRVCGLSHLRLCRISVIARSRAASHVGGKEQPCTIF